VYIYCLQNEDWDRIFGEAQPSKSARQQQVTTPTHGGSTIRPHGGSKSSDHSPERQRSPRKKEQLPHQVPAVAAVMAAGGGGDNPLQSSSDTALLRPPAHGVCLGGGAYMYLRDSVVDIHVLSMDY
jgi:hypothetical protein